MKYKLINTKTEEETLCDKVTIDGFDYYVSEKYNGSKGFYVKDEKFIIEIWRIVESDYFKYDAYILLSRNSKSACGYKDLNGCKKVIATNNPNIDIPKVVDEIDYSKLSEARQMWQKGYNKSQETHPFSEKDMIDFKIWCDNNAGHNWLNLRYKSTQELLQLWKRQQPKKVYYEYNNNKLIK